MIIILKPDVHASGREYQRLLAHLAGLPNVEHRVHEISGTQQTLTEIYLIGNTSQIDQKEIEGFEIVDRVVRVSREYRILGRHKDDSRPSGFEYNGVRFGQDELHVFAGLCAVDTRDRNPAFVRATGRSLAQLSS